MNKKAENTEEYISLHSKWKTHFNAITKVLKETELVETIKWGAPCYTLNGKNLIGMVGFKNHCAVWFHKGALLEDKQEVLINAQPGKTQLLRQLRYSEDDNVNTILLKNYINEAIALEKK
ncbi:MAG: DUF1801 domain-containing protein [Nonlabens sp.]|uniref:DUF1801 domain-containing protein n=1 Tax=Nonlabens sp. TaxID=1888209 RepID=UPI003EF2B69F